MSADSISSLEDILEYSSFGADIDLTTASARNQTAARYLKVTSVGSGGLVLVLSGSAGTSRTLVVTAGEEIVGKITKIVSSGTTVARVRVGW